MICFLHYHCSLDVLHLEAPDEDIDEVDEGELDEGAEDGDEAEDDEDVHGCRIAYLQCKVFGFSSSCNLMQPGVLFSLQAQLSPLPGCMNLQALTWTIMLMLILLEEAPCRSFSALFSAHEPERNPGGHHYYGQWNVPEMIQCDKYQDVDQIFL